jgi:4a-hydroxytetrahydrobiopterin dehydratase
MRVLTHEEIVAALRTRAPWTYEDGQLVLHVKVASFGPIADLVRAILAIAEALDHHPDVCFGYNWLRVSTVTHDAGGITHKDLACIDRILQHRAS